MLCSQDTHVPESEGANVRFLVAGGEQFSGFHCLPVYVECVYVCTCVVCGMQMCWHVCCLYMLHVICVLHVLCMYVVV